MLHSTCSGYACTDCTFALSEAWIREGECAPKYTRYLLGMRFQANCLCKIHEQLSSNSKKLLHHNMICLVFTVRVHILCTVVQGDKQDVFNTMASLPEVVLLPPFVPDDVFPPTVAVDVISGLVFGRTGQHTNNQKSSVSTEFLRVKSPPPPA